MTGSSAGPDTCESASARTACTWAGWAATQAASSSSFATRKWAGQPHRPCMRRTRWTFVGEGIERGRGAGGAGGVARKVEMKNETQRDLALSHPPTRGQCPSPASGHRRSQIRSQVRLFHAFCNLRLIDIKFLDGKIYQVFPLFSVENNSLLLHSFP